MALSYWQSPCGLMAVTADEQGVNSISFVTAAGQAEKPSAITTQCCEQLAAYFAGELTAFTMPLNPAGTAFQHRVWNALREIPYGQTVSYAAIANAIGKPTAARAVGMANGKNPLTIVVPCHRVIGQNGTLTGYAGGLPRKQFLLQLEGAIQ
ncbi:methylated-DNA--[protein]-cysteine S-methyltransferase [Alteromonas lipolytica]|uniref:Methylated-DNA--protein-cysteine methyltransferase n=1 Tax=Alteromonas lipolytica TaxID=1856405 RepID=A0A1E8FI71_9ALTE|nr:methylated-DNA--[protein]-cysteine S-methyltransferase [Alteromonas lipolytica]OFI35594.1 cysteine methyltransferase [Alteromonas lipolytica]GGF77472.1 methylated-DNA--protein-cysteine methyltransferase [Alteromonas lipolytica]